MTVILRNILRRFYASALLLVLDDLAETMKFHFPLFSHLVPHKGPCRVIITTREVGSWSTEMEKRVACVAPFPLEKLVIQSAAELLASTSGLSRLSTLPVAALEPLAEATGCSPFALQVAAGSLRAMVEKPNLTGKLDAEVAVQAAGELTRLLQNEGIADPIFSLLPALKASKNYTEEQNSVFRAIHVTLNKALLDKDKFATFGLFQENAQVPVHLLGIAWGMDLYPERRDSVLASLETASLLKRGRFGCVQLHDLAWEYAQAVIMDSKCTAAINFLDRLKFASEQREWWDLKFGQQDKAVEHVKDAKEEKAVKEIKESKTFLASSLCNLLDLAGRGVEHRSLMRTPQWLSFLHKEGLLKNCLDDLESPPSILVDVLSEYGASDPELARNCSSLLSKRAYNNPSYQAAAVKVNAIEALVKVLESHKLNASVCEKCFFALNIACCSFGQKQGFKLALQSTVSALDIHFETSGPAKMALWTLTNFSGNGGDGLSFLKLAIPPSLKALRFHLNQVKICFSPARAYDPVVVWACIALKSFASKFSDGNKVCIEAGIIPLLCEVLEVHIALPRWADTARVFAECCGALLSLCSADTMSILMATDARNLVRKILELVRIETKWETLFRAKQLYAVLSLTPVADPKVAHCFVASDGNSFSSLAPHPFLPLKCGAPYVITPITFVGKALDILGSLATSTDVIFYTAHHRENQRWRLSTSSFPDYFYLVSDLLTNSERVLSPSSIQVKSGTIVSYLKKESNNAAQLWKVVSSGICDTIRLVNKNSDDLVLGHDGRHVVLETFDKTRNEQLWLMHDIDNSLPDFGAVIGIPLKEWRAAYPGAQIANVSNRTDLTDSDFAYLSGIKALDMSGCNQATLTDAAFAHLRGIHTLHMRNCHQSTITDAAFSHLSGIHTLRMWGCKQSTITDAAFSYLQGIHTLNIEGCNQFTDAAFPALSGIQKLGIEKCSQAALTDAAFVHLKVIDTLYMGYCTQATITGAAFVHLRSLKKLDMKHCRADCVSAAKALGLPV